MISKDFHVHTSFCDGKNTPEEMVKKALSLNLNQIGLVCHGYTPIDESYCIKREKISAFVAEVNNLKRKYKGKISVYCGTEFDYYCDMPISDFDFIIGAVHYVYKNGEYLSVDESKQRVIEIIENHYGGDAYSFCEDYYKTLGDIYAKVTPSFIAHFDLVSKFNEQGDLFDEAHPRYVSAWQACADKLLKNKAVFEINVGAISRGYKTQPYPSPAQIKYLLAGGGRLIINSDAHTVNSIAYQFDKFVKVLN